MSQIHFDLAKLLETHGSDAVLDALRDACGNAGAFSADVDTSDVSDNWHRAHEAMQAARNYIHSAERGESVDLESSLLVLDDTDASNEEIETAMAGREIMAALNESNPEKETSE